jgi:hypothetical protein
MKQNVKVREFGRRVAYLYRDPPCTPHALYHMRKLTSSEKQDELPRFDSDNDKFTTRSHDGLLVVLFYSSVHRLSQSSNDSTLIAINPIKTSKNAKPPSSPRSSCRAWRAWLGTHGKQHEALNVLTETNTHIHLILQANEE